MAEGRRALFDPYRSRFSPKPPGRINRHQEKPNNNEKPEQNMPMTPKPNPKPNKDKKLDNKKKKINSAPCRPQAPAKTTATTRTTRTQPTTPNSSSSKNKNVEPGSVVGSRRLSSHDKDLDDLLRHSIYDLISPKKKEKNSSQSNDGLRIFQIYKEIASVRQENLSVQPYFLKLKTLWNDLAQCFSGGAIENMSELTERQKVMQFLVGLNDSYVTICGQILVMRPFPTVEEAYSEIIGEEKRREWVAELENAAKVIETKWLLRNQNSRSKNGDSNHGIDKANLGSPM